MSSDWREYSLQELCEFQNGFAFKNSDYVSPSTKTWEVFRMGYIARGGGFKEDNTPVFIPKDYNKNLEKYVLRKGDLTIAMTDMKNSMALLGHTARIPEDGRFVLNQRVGLIRVRRTDILDPLYLYYFSNSHDYIINLRARANSGVQVNLSTSAIKESSLRVPPLRVQQSIGKILGNLDTKVKLNEQINQTLEQMAQAIFKSWFVDFEPVKAKMAALEAGGSEEDALIATMQAISGKDQGQLARFKTEQPEQYNELRTTAELFPSAMQDSELGKIPEGWRYGTFEELCLKVESGGTPRRNEPTYWGKGIKWLSSGEVRDVVVYSTNESITNSGLKGSSAKLWPKYTTVVAMYGATAGQVCLLADEMASNQACCGLVPMEICRAYVFILARNSIASLAGKASGSAQQNLNKSLVANHKVLLPEDKVLARFELKVRVLLDAWILNSHECTKLANLRDTLLPKLLSGELSIDKVEQAMVANDYSR